jgi:hypothetical protein
MKAFFTKLIDRIKSATRQTATTQVSTPSRQTSSTQHGLTSKMYEFVVRHETGGRTYYESRLHRPTWPGGASGVTIGIGYDLGYNTASGFDRDWKKLLDPKVFARLHAVLGIKGKEASSRVSALKNISISWDNAISVFNSRTLPRFIAQTKRTFPGSDKLHPDVFGVLVSLVFNRGGSTTGASRAEMKNIREAISGNIKTKDLNNYIADQIVAMKRLWKGKGLDGLLRRRDEEAAIVRGSH